MTSQNGTWQKYVEWVEGLPDNVLLCRKNGHRFAEESDAKRSHWKKRRDRVIEIEVPCLRKCGAHKTSFTDVDGYLARAGKVWMEYEDPDYLIPKEARDGKGYTKEKRAVVRMEFIIRNQALIVEET